MAPIQLAPIKKTMAFLKVGCVIFARFVLLSFLLTTISLDAIVVNESKLSLPGPITTKWKEPKIIQYVILFYGFFFGAP